MEVIRVEKSPGFHNIGNRGPLEIAREKPGLPLVLEAHKVIEHCHLRLPTFGDGRFLEIPFGADITDDALSVEAFLKTAERPFNGLPFFNFDFNWHKGDGGSGFRANGQPFFGKK